jgi:hypothetical protein
VAVTVYPLPTTIDPDEDKVTEEPEILVVQSHATAVPVPSVPAELTFTAPSAEM